MHLPTRRILTAAAVVGTAVSTLAACGGGTSGGQKTSADSTPAVTAPSPTPTPTADPFAGMTADQIVKQAETAMTAATSLRVKGAMTDSGTHGTIDMVMVKGVGCQGTLDLGGEGGMSVVTLGKTLYLKLDSTFLKSMGLGSRASRLKGKYVKTTNANKDLAAMASFCDLNTFAHGGTSSGDTYTKGGLSTVGGQQVLSLKDNKDHSSVLVAVAAPHRVVQINGPTAADGSVTVTYDVATHITPPPASEVVSAATVGM